MKVTLTLQDLPAARLEPQVLVSAKLPEVVMLVTISAALPEFVTVAVSGELVAPTLVPGKVSDVGDRETSGARPVPVRLTPC